MKDDRFKIEGQRDIVRDKNSRAIINTNNAAFTKAKLAKEKRLKDKERIATLESEVTEIKGTLNEILKILKDKS